MGYLSNSQKVDAADVTILPDLCQAESMLMPDIAPGLWGRILKALGVENGSQAARKLNLSKQTVYEWKKKTPGLLTLIEIAESGNTSLDWLVRNIGEANSFEFLAEKQKEIVQKFADQAQREFSEVLRDIVNEGLISRGRKILSGYPDLDPDQIEEMRLLFLMFDFNGESSSASASTTSRRRSG